MGKIEVSPRPKIETSPFFRRNGVDEMAKVSYNRFSMAFGSQENQLELFELRKQATPRSHRETLGRVLLQLRYDQLVLTGMAGIIGLTVVFAFGVERGKELVRSERSLFARQQERTPSPPDVKTDASSTVSEAEPEKSHDPPAQAPTTGQKIKRATRVASKASASPSKAAGSRYAVQVVTYSRSHSAKQEMDRLHADGERAFLVIRNGRTMVYVGPFPSRVNANEKLAMLKARYHDCFVRTL